MSSHEWVHGLVLEGSPTMRCANLGCRVVWWPDRNRPKSVCKGEPAVDPVTMRLAAALLLPSGERPA